MRERLSSRRTYFYDNFFGTFNFKFWKIKKSISYIFMICIHIENQNQRNFYSFVLLKISIFHEFSLEHLRYNLINVSLQLNSSFNNVFNSNWFARNFSVKNWAMRFNFVALNKYKNDKNNDISLTSKFLFILHFLCFFTMLN